MSRKCIDIPEELLTDMLYVQHKSIASVARELGHSTKTIKARMEEYHLVPFHEYIKEQMSEDVIRREYVENGKSIKAIAAQYHCGRDWLSARISELGFLRPADYLPAEDNRIPLSYELLYREYIQEGKTIADIAKEYGYQAKTIRRHLKKHNLYVRRTSFDGMNSSNVSMSKIKDDDEFISLLHSGKTASEIALYYDCSLDTVYRKMKTLNVQTSSNEYNISESFLRRTYIDEQRSCENIAQELACSNGTIRNYLLKYKIPLRKSDEKYKVTLDIEEISHLLEKGFSYNALAEKYNCSMATISSFVSKHHKQHLHKSNISSNEYIVMNALEQHGYSYTMHNRSILNGKEIDILLNDYDIGIEVCPCMTHNSDISLHGNAPKDSTYHQNKKTEAKKNNMALLTSFDWLNIDSLLGYVDIFADNHEKLRSSCNVEVISGSHANAELVQHFIIEYGYDCKGFLLRNEHISYCIIDNENIVCCAVFEQSHIFHDIWKIAAVAIHSSDVKMFIDACQTIINRFASDYNPAVITYNARLDICEELLFKRLGFEETNIIHAPDVHYVHKRGKQVFASDTIFGAFPECLTMENHQVVDYMNAKDFYRVYDCGVLEMKKTY